MNSKPATTRLVLAIAAASLALAPAACARRSKPADPARSLVDASLAEAGERVSADLALLTGSTQSRENITPQGALARTMSLDFDGPVTQALEKICARSGFTLSVVGAPGPVPVIVHVHARDKPLLHILRDIGLQTGPYERLRVVEQARLVELVWLETGPAKPAGKARRPARARPRS